MQEYFEAKLVEALLTDEDDDKDYLEDGDGEDDDEAQMEASLEAKSDAGLLSIIRHAFSHLLGTVKLMPEMPWWLKEGEEWPVDSATNEQFIRFRYNKSHNHEDNSRTIQTIFRYILANGAEYSPAAVQLQVEELDEDSLSLQA
ncbi:uncharacterized protein EDB91DRAFT_1249478 [Suillus paluster]|uniref:uncharacterized protein n=1 Tax=Suillus paluster TaxID=48578 RepID=UPI001B87EE5A|nr:uncharacterized protein EDB91DRAFT_1249478 [Suillus paluster]KAG1738159.1 hypothetical protein EDB91DRAFT_1249478 [Suillus paluster]